MKEINFQNLAKELKEINNWSCWKEEKEEGKEKLKKVPVNANICTAEKLYLAKSNDCNTWAPYHIAEEKSKNLGLGLMFKIEAPYIFLDFDNCIDNNGKINENIKKIMDMVNSYTEVSNSGKGIHIIAKVNKDFPSKVDHAKGIEIYNNRFCAMTGDVLKDYSSNIEERTDIIEKLFSEYFSNHKEGDSNNSQQQNNVSISKEAEILISKIKRRKCSQKFKAFLDGNWKILNEYPTHSEADAGFMFLLARETNKNIKLMDYIFRHSGMYREEKYDKVHYQNGDTYGESLIKNAVTLMTDIFPTEKKALSDMYLEFILSKITLFHDELDECFAIIEINNHKELYSLDSLKFRKYLCMIILNEFRKIVTTEQISTLINALTGIALFNKEKKNTFFRSAMLDNSLYYDFTNDDWQIVKIDATGWEILDNSPILFRRESHQQPQTIPIKGGDINLIWKYINIPDEEKLLFISCLCSMYLPNIPRPILILYGEKGASKTTTAKIIRELVDPSILGTINMPKEEKEFVQILSKHYLASFDNIDIISNPTSNMLCRAVTR